jgi:hypothetical protein
MNRFTDERDAKEFLVGAIVQEASRSGRPLTEVERKMLYFSESGWTLPDIGAVAEAFDQHFDTKKYERKVAGLARSARQHAGKAGAAAWSEAVKRLEAGDHYLFVMVRRPRNRRSDGMTWREIVAVVLFIVGLGVIRPLVLERFLGHFPTREDTGFFDWAGLVAIAGIYLSASLLVGRSRVDGWMERAFVWLRRGKRT